jgi:hypothetical protein
MKETATHGITIKFTARQARWLKETALEERHGHVAKVVKRLVDSARSSDRRKRSYR